MRPITIKHARTWHYRKTRPYIEPSSVLAPLSVFQSWVGSITNTCGYNFRKGQVILQFPLWWHGQPAMLKGWFDRVFVYGRIYSGTKRYDRGHFRGKRAICSVTTGGPASIYSHNGRGGNIDVLMSPINYSLYYVGFDVLRPFCSFGIRGIDVSEQNGGSSSAKQEATKVEGAHEMAWAQRVEGLQQEVPIKFAGWDDWDEDGRLKSGLIRQGYFAEAHTNE